MLVLVLQAAPPCAALDEEPRHPTLLMSAKASVDHRRTHNLLLISRLLSLRDAASPFTLVLDSLSQSARPLLREYIQRAQKVSSRSSSESAQTTTDAACSSTAHSSRTAKSSLSPFPPLLLPPESPRLSLRGASPSRSCKRKSRPPCPAPRVCHCPLPCYMLVIQRQQTYTFALQHTHPPEAAKANTIIPAQALS